MEGEVNHKKLNRDKNDNKKQKQANMGGKLNTNRSNAQIKQDKCKKDTTKKNWQKKSVNGGNDHL